MASSIYDVSSMYDNYRSQMNSSNLSKISGDLKNIPEDASDEEMLAACKEFEKYFIEKVIAQAKKSILTNEDEQGEYMSMFSDTLNQSLADTVEEAGGVGLAQQLYESMKRN